MDRIVRGYRHFITREFPRRRELFEELATGQRPPAMMITCADSRINPALITQTEPGDLFVLRNPGNLVPPHGGVMGGVSATIEYAVQVLRVQDIIICGHSDCGAIKSLLNPDTLERLPAVRAWLRNADRVCSEILRQSVPGEEPCLDAAIRLNVLTQLEHLRTHTEVAAAVSRSELNLHGWVYDIRTGRIEQYMPDERRWVDLLGLDPVCRTETPGTM